MTSLNDNHKARLASAFLHLDELLGSALDKLDRSEHFLFPPYVADVSPVQRRLLGDYLAQLRQALRRFMEAQGIPLAHRRIGAAWALHVTLTSAQIVLDELQPDKLRGYGELSAAGGQEIGALLAGLGAILAQMDACLAPQNGAGFSERLARLAQDTREAQLLRGIADVVARHGLVEFRPTLLWLLERMEEPCLEVAFFGRVSSGKSSLINWLLEAEVLPAGVTPVTTVPTRIVAGKTARATIHFAAGKPAVIELARLREFVSEQHNPDNAQQVVRVVVEFPAAHLRQGVCLVDTPGLGALATAGAAQTLTYLPRCDIAVLLVDAASGPGAEDIALARSLQAAGADLLVLLSRADLLDDAGRDTMLVYLQAKLQDALKTGAAAWPVSVRAPDDELARRWLEQALAPRLARQRELAAASMQRKIDGLRAAVAATLQQLATASAAPGRDANPDATAQETGAARAAIDAARKSVRDWGDVRREHVAAWLDATAAIVAQHWAEHEAAAPDAVAAALAESVRAWSAGLAAELNDARARILRTLQALEQRLPQTAILAELPAPAEQPLFDAAAAVRGVSLQRGIMGALGQGIRRRMAREQLEQQVRAPLEQALSSYERALMAWGQAYLAQLEHAFAAAVAPVEANLRTHDRTWDASALARDLAWLGNAGSDHTAGES